MRGSVIGGTACRKREPMPVADARSARRPRVARRYSRDVSTPAPAVLELIGNTPLVRSDAPSTPGRARCSSSSRSQNPGGSIKDRIGRSMIEAAERDGQIGPGGTLVEATAGNTGLGLALVARAKGYRVVLVIPDKMSRRRCCT